MAKKKSTKASTNASSPPRTSAPSISVQYSSGRPTGWVSHLPSSWIPYVQLARLSLPAALIPIYLPVVFGVLLAGILEPNTTTDTTASWSAILPILLLSSFFFSNAAHGWDDLVDAPIDALIPRTARRPIPRGAISHRAALLFVVINGVGAAATLLLLDRGNLNPSGVHQPSTVRKLFIYALPNILATAYYPFAKRYTNLAQLVLGFCIGWGVFMGAVAAGGEPFRLHSSNHECNLAFIRSKAMTPGLTVFKFPITIPSSLTIGPLFLSLPYLTLFLSCALWYAIYDTIYASEDLDEDTRLGLGSLVVLFHGHIKAALWVMLASLEVCLVLCGLSAGMKTPPFYAVTPVGCGAALGAMIAAVDLRDERSTWWFMYGYWIVGGSILVGLGGELMRR